MEALLTDRLEKLVARDTSWNKEKTEHAVDKYFEFLKKCRDNPDTIIEPTELVDKVWHTAILDTRNYVAFCNDYFGYYLHHTPYEEVKSPYYLACGGNCAVGPGDDRPSRCRK
jgi:hypothetical protein